MLTPVNLVGGRTAWIEPGSVAWATEPSQGAVSLRLMTQDGGVTVVGTLPEIAREYGLAIFERDGSPVAIAPAAISAVLIHGSGSELRTMAGPVTVPTTPAAEIVEQLGAGGQAHDTHGSNAKAARKSPKGG